MALRPRLRSSVAPALSALVLVALSAAPAAPASGGSQSERERCADSLRDARDPSACLEASSLPQLGKLFPIDRRLFVNARGDVGLGTTAPIGKVHVVTRAPEHCLVHLQSSGPTFGEAGLRFRTGQSTVSGWDLYMDDSTLDELGDPDRLGFYHADVGVVMVLDVDGSTGKVGINKRDPSAELDVLGNVCVSGGGMYLTCSDRRLKTDVVELEGALEDVLALRAVRFEWREDGRAAARSDRTSEIGFVAQEVAEVLPEVVAVGGDGYYSVDYGRLTPLLAAALQAQARSLDELRAANDEARRTNEALRTRVERLESLVAELADPHAAPTAADSR